MLMFVNEAPVSVRNFNLCWVNCTTPGFTWPAEPWHNWHFSVLAVGKIFLWGLILVLILFDHFYLWSGTYIKADSTSQHREGERHGKCYRSVYRIPICRNAESLSRSHAAARRAKEAHGFERLGPVLGNHLELQCGSVKTQPAKKKKKKAAEFNQKILRQNPCPGLWTYKRCISEQLVFGIPILELSAVAELQVQKDSRFSPFGLKDLQGLLTRGVGRGT